MIECWLHRIVDVLPLTNKIGKLIRDQTMTRRKKCLVVSGKWHSGIWLWAAKTISCDIVTGHYHGTFRTGPIERRTT